MEAPAGTSLGDVTLAELRLAARNHGMPLEALRYPITPVGLHYLLVHYDIPAVDPGAWRLELGGAVERPLSLSLDDLRAMPSVTLPVTLECAGNGRALLAPRPLSQPWLTEAVGTGEYTGVPLRGLVERGRPARRRGRAAVHRPGPRDRGRRRAVLRAQPRARRGAVRRRAARVRAQRRAAAGAARVPAPARDRRLVRDGARQVARRDHGADRAVPGLPAGGRLPALRRRRRGRRAGHADVPALADGSARRAGLPHSRAPRRRRPRRARGPRLVGLGPRSSASR